ncbi:unnamed protein product [Prunus armeniaca]
MADEINPLLKNNTWTLIPPSSSQNLVGCKWVFRVKHNSYGIIERHKARLVAKGFHQQQGIDYTDTFSSVIKPTTIRVVLSLVVSRGWSLCQLDIKNAFLHGFLKEDVYMTQPQGFIELSRPSHVCKLNKAIYGLKHAPRVWFHRMTCFLLSVGFVQSLADSSLFVHQFGSHTIYFLLYVDDIVITSNDDRLLQSFIDALGRGFDIKDLGNLHYFLGLQVTSQNKGVHISQLKYAYDLLLKHDMLLSKPISTPMSAKAILTSNDGDLLSNPLVFREIVGSLQYLTITRLDITFTVNSITQFKSQPRTPHLIAAKRILRYIKGSLNIILLILLPMLMLIGLAVQTLVVQRQVILFILAPTWSLSALKSNLPLLIPVLSLSIAPFPMLVQSLLVFHARTKHIELDYHFVHEKVALGSHRVCFIPSIDQPADLLTKPLHKHRHVLLTRKLVHAGPPSLREGVREISSSQSKLIV